MTHLTSPDHESTWSAQVWGRAEASAAWNNKLGDPAAAATWLQQDPLLRLGPALTKHLPQSLSGVQLLTWCS